MSVPRAHHIGVVAALLFATTALDAQECKLDQPGEWWPARHADSRRLLSTADRASAESTSKAVEAIVRKTSLTTPVGFAVREWWSYGEVTSRVRLTAYGIAFLSFISCSIYDEHSPHIAFDFNPDPQAWSESDRPMLDENGDGLYFERPRTETLFGSTATYGHFEEENTEGLRVLFTRGGESPTIPVTREEYLRAMILVFEGKDQAKLKETMPSLMKTQYQRWLEDAPARKKRNEEILAGVAQGDPSQVAKVRADLEKVEREGEATFKKTDAEERETLAQARANLTVPGDKLRAQIAAMSPLERAAPAFLYGNQELHPAGTPGAMAVVRRNPAFYRARTSPFEPRALLVTMPGAYKELKAQHWQLYRELDWAAVKRLVNP